MSFGSETGRTRSGTKSFSSKEKKQKRKKQEFHGHRHAHLQESERLDPDEVRARTIFALDRLGHQVLSPEPGGYDLRAWLKSLNSLLDDFQEKIGSERVTEEFRTRRQEAVLTLVPTATSDDIDQEIEELNREEAEAKAALVELVKKAAARRASLKDDREERTKELKAEREKLATLRKARQSRPFFSRVLNTGPSTELAEAKVAELESKLSELEKEIDKPQNARSDSDESTAAKVENTKKLEEIEKRLTDLYSARQAKLQLSEARESATKAISGVISSMKFDQAGKQEG